MRQRTAKAPTDRSRGRPSLDSSKSGKAKHKRGWRRPLRAYLIATALFIVALVGYYSLAGQTAPTGHQQWERRLSLINTAAVDTAARRFHASPTFPFMEALVHVSTNTSGIFEARLDDLTAAEETRERGDDASARDAPTATTATRQTMARVANSLQHAADALYTLLEGMFLGPTDAPLHEMPKGLPRNTFALFASTLHVHGVVLPEYYLRTDAEADHAKSLLRSLNVLDWAVAVPNKRFFNWTSDPCRKVLSGTTTKKWVAYCQRSLTSPSVVAARAAAVLEELIALQPDFAPFRLHYAAALTLMTVPGSDAPHTHPASLQTVRAAKRVWENYERRSQGVDSGDSVMTAQMALLALLEVYALPLEQADEPLRAHTLRALSTLSSCDALLNVVPRGARWPAAPFGDERRPSVLRPEEIKRLLTKVELVVGDKFPSSFREAYAACVA